MAKTVFTILCTICLLASCNNTGNTGNTDNTGTPTTQTDKLVLRFELDANGEISNPEVVEQIVAAGKEVEAHGNKMMITAYTEQSGNAEQDMLTAKAMAKAVRELMKKQGSRNATSVGVDIKGYANPVDSLHPSDLINRRVEITPL